jgi:hypothetical protein
LEFDVIEQELPRDIVYETRSKAMDVLKHKGASKTQLKIAGTKPLGFNLLNIPAGVDVYKLFHYALRKHCLKCDKSKIVELIKRTPDGTVQLDLDIDNEIPKELLAYTFQIEYSPNCPSKFLMRTCKVGFLDQLHHSKSKDRITFGNTLREVSDNMLLRMKEDMQASGR